MTDEQRQWAINRIRAKRAFWVHLVMFVAVNALLVGIWAVTTAGYFWPIWPMLGWSIGLVGHAVSVFIAPMDISEQRIDRELRAGGTGSAS